MTDRHQYRYMATGAEARTDGIKMQLIRYLPGQRSGTTMASATALNDRCNQCCDVTGVRAGHSTA